MRTLLLNNHFLKKRHWVSTIILFLLFASTLLAQDPLQYGIPFAGVPDPRDASIYQVSVRQFSADRNLAGVTAKLDYIKGIGVNVIYLMPIYPIGVTKASGSPYSISDFTSVAPDLGTLNDLRNLVDGAHSRGMAVMLDWVVNQTSWDHPWISTHKDWYQQDGSGNIQSPSPSPGFYYTDCAALNFNNTNMRAAMVQAMRYWIFAANIDGFRCDWADNPPQDFWTNTIGNLRGISSHKLLLLAEGSNEGSQSGCTSCGQNQPGAHYTEGFDFIFGTNFYWNFMKKVYDAGEPATNLDGVSKGEYVGASASQFVARYMSDHDDYNSDGSPYTWLGGGGKAPVLSAFVIASYFRGVPFIYNGIEVGNTSSLVYPWNSGNINWTEDLSVLNEMQKIMNFRNSSDAIRRGTPTSYDGNNVVAFTKISGTEKVVVMANVRNTTENFVIPAGMAGTYKDAYSGASVTLTSGATQSLTAYQYIVLTNANVQTVAVTGVAVSPTSATVNIGDTKQLATTIIPSNSTNQNVTWSSDNATVATVNASGMVIGVAAGTATITVTTADGNKTAPAVITVIPVSVTSVTVAPATTSLFVGQKQQLTATISPSNATNQNVTWTSSDVSVVTVSASGLVTTVAAGTATITATTEDGSKTASATITVNATRTYTVYFYKPSDWGTSINIYWWNPLPSGSLATINWPGSSMGNADNGWYSYTFTDVTSTNLIFNDGANKTADLSRAQTGWFYNGSWYDMKPSTSIAVTGVTVSPASASVDVNSTQLLTATISPSNATNQNVTWTSSDVSVATVSTSGLVTAVAAGTATITATTQDGSKTASATITVKAPRTYTVYFYKPSDWGTGINIYWWNTLPTGALPTVYWPGVSMGNADNGWYSYTFTDVTSTNLIFNDGTKQTADLSRAQTGWFYNGTWYDTKPSTSIAVTGITVSPASASIEVNSTQQLTARISPSNATNQNVTWSSSNIAVAVVSTSGLVTAVATGTVIITSTTQDGSKTANATITVTKGTTTYYQIVNRWQANTYLYDGGNGQVKYGTSPSNNDETYQWTLVDAGNGFTFIKNRATGNYMNIQNQTGAVECTAADQTWWSAMWSFPSTGDGWNYIQNRWFTSDQVNIEHLLGNAQYNGTQSGWWSAMWQFINPENNPIAIAPTNTMATDAIAISPNPASGPVTISVNSSATVAVYNSFGTEVIAPTEINANGSIDLTGLPAGMYLLKINIGTSLVTRTILKN